MTYRSNPAFSYWEFKRELDIKRDRIIEEFEARDRELTRRSKEISMITKESSRCLHIISILTKKGLLKPDIFIDYMNVDDITAYLPIEVGPILKKIWEERDAVLIHELYKS